MWCTAPLKCFKQFSVRKVIIAVCLLTFIFKTVFLQQCSKLQFNKRHVGQRLVGFIILTSLEDSIGTCVKKCFQLTHCVSVNFDTVSKFCDLNNITAEEMTAAVVNSETSILSELSAWPKTMVSSCGDKPCHGREICTPSGNSFLCHNSVQCPEDWIQFNDACYLAEAENVLNFLDAVNYCEGLGADIVQIESADENMFVKDHLLHISETNYWIGLTDEEEGVWRWYKTGELATYFDWLSGEPNGLIDGRGDFDCTVLRVNTDPYSWGDVSCIWKLLPVCELCLAV